MSSAHTTPPPQNVPSVNHRPPIPFFFKTCLPYLLAYPSIVVVGLPTCARIDSQYDARAAYLLTLALSGPSCFHPVQLVLRCENGLVWLGSGRPESEGCDPRPFPGWAPSLGSSGRGYTHFRVSAGGGKPQQRSASRGCVGGGASAPGSGDVVGHPRKDGTARLVRPFCLAANPTMRVSHRHHSSLDMHMTCRLPS
ncbi:hypothetical protein LY76DRAFT_279009 [Colletotrichum caudatum]|nr:hypothetical protein LY76DRAFT_279009 [Colletotrichum caudatum]